MSTGDAILPPSIPPPWFDETPPPPSTTAAHDPETPAKQRSELDVPDTVSSPSKRWPSGTLQPRTPVPTTAPPSTARRRWRAGVLHAMRPFRRLRGKQADPSEIIVKRRRSLVG